jgi:hypothetical protein
MIGEHRLGAQRQHRPCRQHGDERNRDPHPDRGPLDVIVHRPANPA